jgi:DnaJ-class molecular chaperone
MNKLKMNKINDAYDILGLKKGSSIEEIKKAYRAKALVAHPDKNKGKCKSHDEFIKINIAYNILMDKNRKSEYDNLDVQDRGELYNDIINYFQNKYPDWYTMLYEIMTNIYTNDEELEPTSTDMDFGNIFKGIYCKLFKPKTKSSWIQKQKVVTRILEQCEILDDSIYIYVNVSILEKYQNEFKFLVLNNAKDDSYVSMIVPARETEIIYPNYIEINNKHYDIIVRLITNKDRQFKIVNNDLYVNKSISLFQYLYGGKVSFRHIDGQTINVVIPSCINKRALFTIEGKGLPCTKESDIEHNKSNTKKDHDMLTVESDSSTPDHNNSDDSDEDDDYVDITDNMIDVNYGDLHVNFTIDKLDNETVKTQIFEMFPTPKLQ